MKKVTALCGLPGAGKTTYWKNNLKDQGVPLLDIREIYRINPKIKWRDAFHALLQQLDKALETHDHVAVEAKFGLGSYQTTTLIEYCANYGHELVQVRLNESLRTLRQRIDARHAETMKNLTDPDEIAEEKRYYEACLEILGF